MREPFRQTERDHWKVSADDSRATGIKLRRLRVESNTGSSILLEKESGIQALGDTHISFRTNCGEK